jgi:uncharacterized RDD family membrane protein YckC
LPFSSREPEPASLHIRAAAGWIDYLIAFLVPYVPLMLAIGNEDFHLRFFMERTLYSVWHHLAFLGFGFLYFGVAEGIWGAGLGKRLKGLRVVHTDGRPPGVGRALIRVVLPILSIEGVRIPLLLTTISATRIDDMTTPEIVIYSAATALCPWIPVLLTLTARRANGFATVWDIASGTRVVVKPKGTVRQSIEPAARAEIPVERGEWLGPYQVVREIVPGEWILASDPVLRRQVWLLRRASSGLSHARRNVARPGRLRWLQKVETAEAIWDAFEAIQGRPFPSLVEDGKRVSWGTLRHWLHDVASELWAATGDRTLPPALSLDHVWITTRGHAVLLDEPWPDVRASAEGIPVGDVAGQQRFLAAIAACVESTTLPLHARPMLRSLEEGRFEKLSFFTGTLRGLLDKPAEVDTAIRAGSIFMLPFYVWIMVFVGTYQGAEWLYEIVGDSAVSLAMATTILLLVGGALTQVLELPFRTTMGHSIFRLAVVDDKGEPVGISVLLARWALVWLPLLLPMSVAALLFRRAQGIAVVGGLVLLLLWIGAAGYAVIHPNRGLHDRLAGTWVVRR